MTTQSKTFDPSRSIAPESFLNLSKNKRKQLYKMGTPDPISKRSMKRAARGFVSLTVSSRKHRRTLNRQLIGRAINGKLVDVGERIEFYKDGHKNTHTGSRANKYH